MLTIRYLSNMIDQCDLSKPKEAPWEGRTLEFYAPYDAAGCLVNQRSFKRSEFDHIPADGDSLLFVKTEMNPGDLFVGALFSGARGLISNQLTSPFGFSSSARDAFLGGAIPAYGLFNHYKNMFSFFSGFLGGLGAGSIPEIGGGADGSAQGTFSFDRVQNTFGSDAPVKLVYGEVEMGGHLVGQYTRFGADGREVLYAKYLMGFGAFTRFGDSSGTSYTSDQDSLTGSNIPTGFYINDRNGEDLSSVEVSFRTGTGSQTVLPGWEEQVTQRREASGRLKTGSDNAIYWDTLEAVNAVDVNVTFPRGLYKNSSSGKLVESRVDLEVAVYQTDGTLIESKSVSVHEKNRTPGFGRTIKLGPFTTQKVRVKVYRSDGELFPDDQLANDEAHLQSVNEVLSVPQVHPGYAMLGIKVTKDDKLPSVERVVCRVQGRKVLVYDDGTETFSVAYSNNPAWIVYDLLTNILVGAGDYVTADDIDIDSFDELSDDSAELIPTYTGSGSTEARYQWDGVIDQVSSVWDVCQGILSTARSFMVRTGRTVKIQTYKDKAVSQTFTNDHRLLDNSITESYLSPKREPNQFEVRFRDRDNRYAEGSVTIEPADFDSDEYSIRQESINLVGVTRATQAKRHAAYMYRLAQMPNRRVTIKTNMMAVGVEPGDIISVPTDHVGNAISGRIQAATTGSITMDKQISFVQDRNYRLVEIDRATGVRSIFEFTPTSTFSSQQVSGYSGSVPPANPGSPSSSIGNFYVIGEREEEADLYIVEDVKHNPGGESEVSAQIFLPEVATDETEPVADTTFEDVGGGSAPSNVTSLSASETYDSTLDRSTIDVSWTAGSTTSYYVIYYKYLSSGWVPIAQTSGTSASFEIDAEPGYILTIAVQPIAADGSRETDIDNLTSTTLTLENGGIIPGDVGTITVTQISGTEYTLGFTHLTPGTRDGYLVTMGESLEGDLISTANSNSITVRACQVDRNFTVRGTMGDFYSANGSRAVVPATQYPTYSSDEESVTVNFQTMGTFYGGAVVQWFEDWILLQAVPGVPVTWVSSTADLGTSADTHISWDVNVMPWIATAAEYFNSGTAGETAHGNMSSRGACVDWSLTLEHRTGIIGTWKETPLRGLSLIDVVITGRQFRFVLRGKGLDSDGVTRLAMCDRLAYALFR